jgi:glycosyltransferase involved in cell wall biosynthesis
MTSTSRLVLIPSYNTGPRLLSTVQEALRHWAPVWVVVDGSTDGSERPVEALAAADPRLRILRLARNRGKGAAVAAGVDAALAAGFTHALAMDSDGQHPADLIGRFMAISAEHPAAMILGRPIFGPEAPAARRQGRKLSIAMVRLEILGEGIDDPLFGFRVYPLSALQQAMRATLWARGFDFDQEAIVRMFWSGTPTVNVPAPCRYLGKADGGVSHFNYLRDNALLVWLQLRLLGQLSWRWPRILQLRRARRGALALLLAAGLAARPAGAAALANPDPAISAADARWAPILHQLELPGNRQSHFEERRYFPFRTGPVVLSGTVRISPAHGLSLEYRQPDYRVVIVDGDGLLMRDSQGRDRPVPNDPHMAQAMGAFVSILSFDPKRIEEHYILHGSQAGPDWRISLVPRQTGDWSAIVLTGNADGLAGIELVRSQSLRITIALSAPRSDVTFTPADLTRYFRP